MTKTNHALTITRAAIDDIQRGIKKLERVAELMKQEAQETEAARLGRECENQADYINEHLSDVRYALIDAEKEAK